MHVSVLKLAVTIPDAGSLKSKRRVVRSLKERLAARFPVSVAEVGGHDLWNYAEIAAAVVGREGSWCGEVLEEVRAFVARAPDLVLGMCEVEDLL